MLESKVQKMIMDCLHRNEWIAQKIESSSNGGWPDIYALKNGVHVWIETKRPGKAARPLQVYWHNKIKKQKGVVFVADTFDKFLEQMTLNKIAL